MHTCVIALCEGWFYFGFFGARVEKENERVKLDDENYRAHII